MRRQVPAGAVRAATRATLARHLPRWCLGVASVRAVTNRDRRSQARLSAYPRCPGVQLKERRSNPGPPGTGASWRRRRTAHPPLLTSFPSPRCTLSEAPLPWPSRIAAAHSLPPRAKPDRCCKPDRGNTHCASQVDCSPPLERPSIAAPGELAPPSYPPVATATPPRRLGPQLTAGRTRPTTPKNHCARLVRAGGLVRLLCRPTPARGMLGCVVHLPAGSLSVPGAPRAGQCYCVDWSSELLLLCVTIPERASSTQPIEVSPISCVPWDSYPLRIEPRLPK